MVWWFGYAAAVIIVGYIIFVYQYYRYSDVNLGNKMLSKYSLGKNPPGSLFYNYDGVQYDDRQARASAIMHLRDKETLGEVSRELYAIDIKPTCGVFDTSCIVV